MKRNKNIPVLKKMLKIFIKSADIIMFSVILECAFIVLIKERSSNKLLLFTSSVSIVLICLLTETYKEKKERVRVFDKMKRELQTEKILLMSDSEISELLNVKSFAFIRKENPDKYEVVSEIGKRPKYLICVQHSSLIDAIIQDYSPDTQILSIAELAQMMHVTCSSSEVEKRVSDNRKMHFDLGRFKQIMGARWNRYFLLGTLLLVLSFFTRHKIYYRSIASISLILSVFKGVFDRKGHRIISVSFLDNIER